MREYDFKTLEAMREPQKTYEHFPLPVMITDLNFQLYWSNVQAEKHSFVALLPGIAAELDCDEIIRDVEERGSSTIADVIALSGMRISALPIRDEGNTVALTLILMDSSILPDVEGILRSGRTASALSKGMINTMEGVFIAMDDAAAKADIMNEGWVKSGYTHISRHCYKMLRVSHNIALYTQFQSDACDIDSVAVDIFDLLREWEPVVVQMAEEMGTPLSFSIPDAPDFPDMANKAVCVKLNRERFGVVLTNILHNALYFTRPGNEIALTVEHQQSGNTVTITVADKGIGIPQEILPQVFRPYTAHARGETMGLGLTLCKLYMDSVGGKIEITSQPDKGTTVTLTFRVAQFSAKLPLAQKRGQSMTAHRFSPLYIGLTDATISPYNSDCK